MKNKKSLIIIIIIIAIILIGVIVALMLNKEKTALSELYDKSKLGYISYDASKWELSETDSKLLSKQTEGTSINLLSEKIEGYTLDEYTKASKEALKMLGDSINMISEEDSTINSLKAKIITYEIKQNNKTVKIQQYIILDKNTIFALTYGSLADDFDKEYANFENIAKSFKIK